MILYFGNALSQHGHAQAMMETLAPRLAESQTVRIYSARKNQAARLMDMIAAVIIHRNEADLIFIDTYSTFAFWYFVAVSSLSRFFKIPYIPVLRGGNLPARIKDQGVYLNGLFKNAAVNISPSSYLQRNFQQAGHVTICIPNFLELEKYPFKQRAAFRPRLLWVRSFHRIYNPSLAVRLVHALMAKYPDVQLCMVGQDKDGTRAETEALAKTLNVESKIEFVGKLSKAEWTAAAARYDIFINTTDYDNMPVSVIEAMSLGLPVISTNVGGIPDLIASGVDGCLVDRDDVKGFESAVVQLVENAAWGRSIATAARKKTEMFSWQRVGPLWHEVIERYRKKR